MKENAIRSSVDFIKFLITKNNILNNESQIN